MKIKVADFKKMIKEAKKELIQKTIKVGPMQLKKLVETLAKKVRGEKKEKNKN